MAARLRLAGMDRYEAHWAFEGFRFDASDREFVQQLLAHRFEDVQVLLTERGIRATWTPMAQSAKAAAEESEDVKVWLREELTKRFPWFDRIV